MKKTLLVAIFSLVASFTASSNIAAYAEEQDESLLTELRQDSNFNLEDYPIKKDEVIDGKHVYDLEIMDLKETRQDHVALYIYNPTGLVTAKAISVCFDDSQFDDIKYKYYDLTLQEELPGKNIQKYLINGVTVNHNFLKRSYILGAIQRTAYPDEEIKNESVITTIGLKAGICFKVKEDADGNVTYERLTKDVLELTNQFRFRFIVPNSEISSRYYTQNECIVFNTNYNIDEIYDISVEFDTIGFVFYAKITNSDGNMAGSPGCYYQIDEYIKQYGYIDTTTYIGPKFKKDTKQHILKTISADDEFGNKPGWFGKKRKWKAIQSTDNLTKDAELNKYIYEKYEEVRTTSWFLAYYDSQITIDGTKPNHWEISGTLAMDTAIVRMKFLSEGTVYNLAVVDDKATGTDSSVIPPDKNAWLKALILFLVSVVVVISLIAAIVKGGIKVVFKGIVWLIGLPFRLLNKFFNWLFKPRGKKKKGRDTNDW